MPKVLLVSLVAVLASGAAARVVVERNEPTVALQRLPAGGIQRRVATDGSGVAHVVYRSTNLSAPARYACRAYAESH